MLVVSSIQYLQSTVAVLWGDSSRIFFLYIKLQEKLPSYTLKFNSPPSTCPISSSNLYQPVSVNSKPIALKKV